MGVYRADLKVEKKMYVVVNAENQSEASEKIFNEVSKMAKENSDENTRYIIENFTEIPMPKSPIEIERSK